MYHTFPFARFARRAARVMGHPVAFLVSVLLIVAWALTGPIFRFSDTWQLAINTSTTIVTFLMVFLIQNTQNRDSEAMQLKLDEMIRSVEGAHNALLDLEELSEDELDRLKGLYEELARRARESLRLGFLDTDTPDLQGSSGTPLLPWAQKNPSPGGGVLFDKDGRIIWSAGTGPRP